MLRLPEPHTKRTLLHLSRAIEAVHLADQGPRTIGIVLFQHRRYFDESRERFERWTAAVGGPTIVAGFVGHPPYRRRGDLHPVQLDQAHSLAAEWTIVVTDGRSAVAMVAEDRSIGDDVPDPMRMFDTRITFSPPHVADDFDRLTDSLGPALPADVTAALRAAAKRCSRLPLADDETKLRPVLHVADSQVLAPLRFGT